jgi:hypothetical protein
MHPNLSLFALHLALISAIHPGIRLTNRIRNAIIRVCWNIHEVPVVVVCVTVLTRASIYALETVRSAGHALSHRKTGIWEFSFWAGPNTSKFHLSERIS